jgi:hypothetical protein
MKNIILTLIITLSLNAFAQVGVNTTNPDPSAILDVESTTSGFLPPRMTEIQMNDINSPAEGLIVYCTDCVSNGLQSFDGVKWQSIGNITPNEDNLKIIRGNVSELGIKEQGAGFTSTLGVDANSYVITFDTEFSSLPSITVQTGDPDSSNNTISNIALLTKSQVIIVTQNGVNTAGKPSWFSFIAIGPQ